MRAGLAAGAEDAYPIAMVPKLARPELEAAVGRVARRVDEAIEGLRPYGRSPLWAEALSATLAIERGATHLLRAQLVLLGSLAAGGPAEGEGLERFAAGVELLHLFMLVHDDVMDNAVLRRGKPTLRVALQAADTALGWDQARDLAVVVGNLLHVLAMRHLLAGPDRAAGEPAACALVLEGSCRAGAGQFHDLLGFRGLDDDDEAFRRELCDKTAYHAFAAPFAAGVALAQGSSTEGRAGDEALAWGSHLGLAFQAADDLADLVSSPSVLGKDAMRDLHEGRASLPLLLLRRRATGADRELLDSIVGKKNIEFGERARLEDLVGACGVVGACAAWARAELGEARRVREASGLTAAGREGMQAIEEGLRAYVEVIATSAASEG
jgi:geranylgeranyl diphosphate synthase, type I